MDKSTPQSNPSLFFSTFTKLVSILWKISKKVMYCLLCYCIVATFDYVYRYHWVHVDYNYFLFDKGGTVRGKILIPEGIVASRNCDKLFGWQSIHVARDYQGLCPWAKERANHKVGMADLWFDFPRHNLIFDSRHEKDGPVDGVLGVMSYPDIGAPFNLQKDITFFMKDTKRGGLVGQDMFDYYYMHFLNLSGSSKYDITDLGFDEESGMNKYRVVEHWKNSNFSNDLYTNDDPKQPKYFVVCHYINENVKANHCNSMFLYKDLVSIEYSIPREQLKYHKEIKDQLLNFMRQYEIPRPY